MKKAICHYSFHRRWKDENWTVERLISEVKSLGAEGIDFHAGLLEASNVSPHLIKNALKESGLFLSSISLSNDFCQDSATELKNQIDKVRKWLIIADSLKAPVSRIFGGHLQDRSNAQAAASARQCVLDALGQVVKEAEKYGVILALENHGGMPCTAEEQVEIIKAVGSPFLRATIDVGNYLQGGQEGHVGTQIAAKYATYVHFKDFRKKSSTVKPWGWETEACTVGKGDVDHRSCLIALKKAAYTGFIALEYEGPDDERLGVPESMEFITNLMKEF